MIDLSQRSYEKELMDGANIPFEAMVQTLKELNVVNSRLGGHATTLRGLKQLMNSEAAVSICEIGCGGGDNLSAIQQFCSRQHISASFIGIDINPGCIAFAQQKYPHLNCDWICSDYALVKFEKQKPDIIFSSLFCHHFTDAQLVRMLSWLKENSSKGFFINDLHRHWLAYYLIKYITRFFSRSYLVKNDASLSVARGFIKKDWQQLFQQAGIQPPHISWRWAFRYLVTAKNVHV